MFAVALPLGDRRFEIMPVPAGSAQRVCADRGAELIEVFFSHDDAAAFVENEERHLVDPD
jgi:hypothetical protein